MLNISWQGTPIEHCPNRRCLGITLDRTYKPQHHKLKKWSLRTTPYDASHIQPREPLSIQRHVVSISLFDGQFF